MNPQKRKLLMYAGGAATALTLSGGLMAAGAFAATSTSTTSTSPMSSLVSKIATKFGLNQADVQAVFDQDQTDHKAQMKADEETRLTQAVTDGKLTQAQKDLIVAKEAELDTAHEAAMASGTKPTETEMQAERDALKKWATDNSIDMKWLHEGFGGPGGRGHGGPGGPDDAPTDSTSSTDTSTSTSTSSGS